MTGLAALLKEATLESHRRAESGDLQRQLATGELDRSTLSLYLAQLHGVHAALEHHFDTHDSMASLVGWSDGFRHSRRLSADLIALGFEPGQLGTVEATRSFVATMARTVQGAPASLIGYFYVLEGSMNGNRFIARALGQRGGAGACSWTYFDPYGEAQRERWLEFRRVLDSLPFDDHVRSTVIDAALAMFDAITAICADVMNSSSSDLKFDESEAASAPISSASSN